MKNLTKF
jgi:phospholipid-transporting ATPase